MEYFEQKGSLGQKLNNYPSKADNKALDWSQMGPKIQQGMQDQRRRQRWPFFLLFFVGVAILGFGTYYFTGRPGLADAGTGSSVGAKTSITENSDENNSSSVRIDAQGNDLKPKADHAITQATERTHSAAGDRSNSVHYPGSNTESRLANKESDEILAVPVTSRNEAPYPTLSSGSSGAVTSFQPQSTLDGVTTSTSRLKREAAETSLSPFSPPDTRAIAGPPNLAPDRAVRQLHLKSGEQISSFFPKQPSYQSGLATKVAQSELNPPVEIDPTFEKERRPTYISAIDGMGFLLGDEGNSPTSLDRFRMWQPGVQIDFPLTDYLTLYTGANLNNIFFRERFQGSRNTIIFAPGTIDTILINTAAGTQSTVFTDSIPGTQRRNFQHNNQLNSISVPLMLGYNSRSSGRRWAFEVRGGFDLSFATRSEGRTIDSSDGFTSRDLEYASGQSFRMAGRLEAVVYYIANKKQAGYVVLSYRHPFQGLQAGGNTYQFRTLSLKTGYYISRL